MRKWIWVTPRESPWRSISTTPDRDNLTYLAETSNPAVATVSTSGRSVEGTGVARGTARITVVARDPGGPRGAAVIRRDRAQATPRMYGTIPDHTLNVGETFSVDLHPYFTDAGRGPADVHGGRVLRPCGLGHHIGHRHDGGRTGGRGTSITVTARDPEGGEARAAHPR